MLRLYLRPRFGGRKINSIEWVEVELMATSMIEQGLSPKSAREAISVLSLIMQTAMTARVIRENPAAGHSLPTQEAAGEGADDAANRASGRAHRARYRSAVWLLALAGLRASELCGLRVMDIDWERHTVTVNEVQMWVKGELVVKGPEDSQRRAHHPAAGVADRRPLQGAGRASTDHGHARTATDRLFASPTGKPMLDHTMWRIDQPRAESSGTSPFRPYDLRHSHASLLIDLGAHPKAISERMGHTEIGVTMNVYGHLFEGAQGELTKDLDDLLERSRSEASDEGGKGRTGREKGGSHRSTTVTHGQQRSLENQS